MAHPLILWDPNSQALSFSFLQRWGIFLLWTVQGGGKGGEVVWRILDSMLIKISCMQKPHEFCHGFFQTRFMSLLRIKLKQSSHNQICRCGKLGNSLKNTGPAFHGWWAMFPPVAWHCWVLCVIQRDRMRSTAQHVLSHPCAAKPTNVLPRLQDDYVSPRNLLERVFRALRLLGWHFGVCGKIFSCKWYCKTLEVRILFFFI